MKVACYGSMTRILISHLVSRPDRQSSRKITTQCPGITNQQWPGITNKQCPVITTKQCPGISTQIIVVMRARERPLILSPALRGLTLTSHRLIFLLLALVSVTQCPGLLYRETMKLPKCVIQKLALLSPLREKGIENTEGKGVRKSERKR